MAYIFLSDLSTKQQTWSVKVKVVRLWEFINNNIDELMSFDMILMDEKVNNNNECEFLHVKFKDVSNNQNQVRFIAIWMCTSHVNCLLHVKFKDL
jgi:hypothetical protein